MRQNNKTVTMYCKGRGSSSIKSSSNFIHKIGITLWVLCALI